jgi:gas vesicle protein
MADEVPTTVRSIVEKVLEADVADQIARRSRELATAVSEATDAVSARAGEAWRESEPARRDAEKAMRAASKDALSWSRRTWKKDLRPTLRDLWSRRTMAIGAAGAAIPVSRGIAEDAAVRLGLKKRREQRHWMAFFLGLLIGAAAGAAVALLTAPKPGREMRDELAEKAKDAAERAREAAGGAGEWVPLFQRPEAEVAAVNGEPSASIIEPAPEATSDVTPEGEEPH